MVVEYDELIKQLRKRKGELEQKVQQLNQQIQQLQQQGNQLVTEHVKVTAKIEQLEELQQEASGGGKRQTDRPASKAKR